jgi:sugar lactone lactonase YvrE
LNLLFQLSKLCPFAGKVNQWQTSSEDKWVDGVCALDKDGNLLYTARTEADLVNIYNADGELVRSFTKS